MRELFDDIVETMTEFFVFYIPIVIVIFTALSCNPWYLTMIATCSTPRCQCKKECINSGGKFIRYSYGSTYVADSCICRYADGTTNIY